MGVERQNLRSPKPPGLGPGEANAVAEAVNLGEAERLLREVALAGVLEAAAEALRSGRGLIGNGAEDVVREIWHNYAGAGINGGDVDRRASARAGDFDQAATKNDKSSREELATFLVERNGALKECAKPSVYSQLCVCDACDVDPGYDEHQHK